MIFLISFVTVKISLDNFFITCAVEGQIRYHVGPFLDFKSIQLIILMVLPRTSGIPEPHNLALFSVCMQFWILQLGILLVLPYSVQLQRISLAICVTASP